MLKKWLAIVLAISLALCLMPAASAAGTEAQDAADAPLCPGPFPRHGDGRGGGACFCAFQPSDTGRGGDDAGAAAGAGRGGPGRHVGDAPSRDLADWMAPYAGLAYESGLTTGTGETSFEGDAPVTAAQFLTLCAARPGL